jgi:hypothetical protein
MQEIKLFFFILSIVYSLRYVIEFILKFISNNTEPIVLTKTEGIVMYFSISYIITYILI